jgi:transposase
MRRNKNFSLEELTSLKCWLQFGVKTKEMAARLGRSEAGVRLQVKRIKTLPPNASLLPPPPKSGRPFKTTKVQDERLKKYVVKNPFKTARELKNEVPGWSDVPVRTIQHRLQKNLDLPARRAAKKPLLTQKMKEKRIAFAKKYKNWTSEQWRDVMFSDEAKFAIVNSRSVTVRRSKSMNRYADKYVVKTVKHSPSVMMWACFIGRSGRGGMYALPQNTTMNGEKYKVVLEDHLIPFMKATKTPYFLQDGAPCHKSKVVMNHLKQYEKEFTIMDWPGNSPDLNPIENCWSYMKRKLKGDSTITSARKLEDAIKLMWVKDMDLKYFQNLADSMPKRIKWVLEHNGEMTNY